MDGGPFYDMSNYHGRIFRHGKMIWHTQSIAWFDNPNFYMNEFLENSLDMGYFCLTGIHLHAMGNPAPGYRKSAIQLFGWLETNYPYLHWFKGNQLAEFWDELGSISNIEQTGFGNEITLNWDGANSQDQTVIVHLNDSELSPVSCYVDGIITELEQRNSRIFIKLPELQIGHHELTLSLDSDNNSTPPRQTHRDFAKFNGGFLSIYKFFDNPVLLQISLYDVLGRKVMSFDDILAEKGENHLSLPVSKLPAGVVFVKVEDGVKSTFYTVKVLR
jgi:hypothetical protein